MLARNRDPTDIYHSTYSLGRFDLALYLRLEAGADSIEHTVVDPNASRSCSTLLRKQVRI